MQFMIDLYVSPTLVDFSIKLVKTVTKLVLISQIVPFGECCLLLDCRIVFYLSSLGCG